MTGVSKNRASWLAYNVLPHEAALRAWLRSRRVFDLDIDDIVQETYAKLAALASTDAIYDPRSYMFQVANSIILSHLRRSRVVSITAAANLDHLGLASPDPSAEKLLESRDELRELTKVLDSLPKPCREAFIMRRITGLSQRDTAERLGVSEKTVEKYMAKGVRLLMDVFGRGGKSPSRASNLSNRTQIGHDTKVVEPGN